MPPLPHQTTNPSDLEPALRRSDLVATAPEVDRKWRRLLLAAAVVLVLHLPFVLLNRLEVPHTEPLPHRRLAALPQESAESLSPACAEMWQWIRLTDASQWYYPTKGGFSQWNTRPVSEIPELPRAAIVPRVLPVREFSPSRLHADPAVPNDQEFLKLTAFRPAEPAAAIETPPALPPRWRRLGGGALAEPPALASDDRALLEKADVRNALFAAGCRPTRLEVQFRPAFALPRILLRGSCGVAELDQAAIQALRDALKALPAPARHLENTYEIDWLF